MTGDEAITDLFFDRPERGIREPDSQKTQHLLERTVFSMRKCSIFLSAVICTLLALTACGSSGAQDSVSAERRSRDTISAELGIDVSTGKVCSSTDTHGGFHGDGVSCIALSFDDDHVLYQIKEHSAWSPFPLDETTQALVYGIESEAGSIGPFLNDGSGSLLVPGIENGYYILIDRHRDQETDILSRASFNFTVGLYDTDSSTLYFCELDT
jgi:hypothetical protein